MALRSGRQLPLGVNSVGISLPDREGSARFPLSESSTGVGIALSSNQASGTAIHAANSRSQDEVYLWATNTGSEDATLTISFNNSNTSTSTNKFTLTVGSNQGLTLICPGLPTRNITLYGAGSDAGVKVFGFVMRYYPRVPNQRIPANGSGFDGSQ